MSAAESQRRVEEARLAEMEKLKKGVVVRLVYHSGWKKIAERYEFAIVTVPGKKIAEAALIKTKCLKSTEECTGMGRLLCTHVVNVPGKVKKITINLASGSRTTFPQAAKDALRRHCGNVSSHWERPTWKIWDGEAVEHDNWEK